MGFLKTQIQPNGTLVILSPQQTSITMGKAAHKVSSKLKNVKHHFLPKKRKPIRCNPLHWRWVQNVESRRLIFCHKHESLVLEDGTRGRVLGLFKVFILWNWCWCIYVLFCLRFARCVFYYIVCNTLNSFSEILLQKLFK